MTETRKYDASKGLNNPPINELESKAGCRYRLVSAVAKRARTLMDENKKSDSNRDNSSKDNKIVISDNDALDRAINEFYEDKYEILSED